MAGPSLMPIFTPVAPEFSLQSTFFSASDASSYTDTAVDLGRATPSRLIIVAISTKHNNSGQTISSVTVGGNALDPDIFRNNTGNSVNGQVAIYSGEIPTGTSGDVVVTFTGTMRCCMIGTYRAANLASNDLFDSDPASDIDDQNSMSLNIPAGGIAIGVCSHVSGSDSVTWSGLTEDDDETDSGSCSVASAGILAAETGRAISVTAGGGPSRYACASYG